MSISLMRRTFGVIFVFVLILSLGAISSSQASASTATPFTPLASRVNHSITVRIALVGLSDVDRDELLWNLEPEIEPMIQVSSSPQGLSELSYGAKFKINYDIVAVSSQATNGLEDYLKSIGSKEKVPKFLDGYGYWSSASDKTNYAVFDAQKTEDWINSHVSDFGAIPDDGYTVIVADLRDVSNMHHYYERQYLSLDPASTKAKYYTKPEIFPIVNWMASWGGHHRFYFLDLSGGDPQYDYTQDGHIPIQDFNIRYYNSEKYKFKRDVHTVTEYVADYVAEAVRNLFLPSYVYAPTYAKSYKIVINIFDDTGRMQLDRVSDYLSADLVKKAFETVIPYATWDVSVTAHRLSDDAALDEVVSNSVIFSSGKIAGTFGDKVYIDYYDYRPIYRYLQSHATQYFDSSSGDSVVLPVYEFVLKSSSRFAQTWQEQIGSISKGPDSPDRTFGGISLGDLVIIGRSERNIFDFGYEFTQTTIHELGHSIGLMHPHSYGWTEDYVPSAMSYTTYEYGFSQFDADAVQRGHADFFLSQVQGAMQASSTMTMQNTEAQDLMEQATSSYQNALSSYSKGDYQSATNALQSLSGLLNQAFEKEASSIQEKIAKTSATSDTAKKLLENSNGLINSAREQMRAGNLGAAFDLLAEASKTQEAAQIVADQFQTTLLMGLGIGIVVGVAAGLVIYRVRRSAKRNSHSGLGLSVDRPPGRDVTLAEYCRKCGAKLSEASKFCVQCGATQTEYDLGV